MERRLRDPEFHVRKMAFNELLENLAYYRDFIHRPTRGLPLELRTRLKNAQVIFNKSVWPEEQFVEQMGLLDSEEYFNLIPEMPAD